MRTAGIKVTVADIRRLIEGKSLTINLPADVTTLQVTLYGMEDAKRDAKADFLANMHKVADAIPGLKKDRVDSFLNMVAEKIGNKH
jgi:hypothetical protein